jgi:hypothetical protein
MMDASLTVYLVVVDPYPMFVFIKHEWYCLLVRCAWKLLWSGIDANLQNLVKPSVWAKGIDRGNWAKFSDYSAVAKSFKPIPLFHRTNIAPWASYQRIDSHAQSYKKLDSLRNRSGIDGRNPDRLQERLENAEL